MDTISGAVYGPAPLPPPPEIAILTYARDHHSTSHRQGMDVAYILVDEYEAQTNGKQSTEIVKTFTCVVGGLSELWNWCCIDYRLMCPQMWFISTY